MRLAQHQCLWTSICCDKSSKADIPFLLLKSHCFSEFFSGQLNYQKKDAQSDWRAKRQQLSINCLSFLVICLKKPERWIIANYSVLLRRRCRLPNPNYSVCSPSGERYECLPSKKTACQIKWEPGVAFRYYVVMSWNLHSETPKLIHCYTLLSINGFLSKGSKVPRLSTHGQKRNT